MIPTDGTKTIDFEVQERVNYHIGQLLNAADFLDEQSYLMARDDRHQRMLHGYGTAIGLEVTIDRPLDPIDEITVHEGIGVDRAGRTFVVHQAQCAKNVEEWWNANNRPNAIYVVARYDEIANKPVLLAGQPCDDTVDGTVHSRRRDSMALELWNHRPAMPIFEASRWMQQLLRRIHLDATADGSDKKILDEAIELIREQQAFSASVRNAYRITVKELDQLLDGWVTQVLPTIHALDHNDDDFPWVLLAEFHLARTRRDTPKLTKGKAQAEAPVRPLLLHTQLLQPPLGIGRQGGGSASAAPSQALMTVTSNYDAEARALALELWFHLDQQADQQGAFLAQAPQISVHLESTDGTPPTLLDFALVPEATLSNVYTYAARFITQSTETQPAYLRVSIPATTPVTVKGETKTLASYMEETNVQYQGHQPAYGDQGGNFVTYVRTRVPPAGGVPHLIAGRDEEAETPGEKPASESSSGSRRRRSGESRS